MGIKVKELVWSIFTANPVNYGQILWYDFLQYIPKESPRKVATQLTCARFWSLCILDLHKQAMLDMGDDSSLFVTRDLKRYIASKDQSMFGPLRRLPGHILESIGLNTLEVTNHIEATDGIDPYHSSPPHPNQSAPTATQVPPTIDTPKQPKTKRVKSLAVIKKHPVNIMKKGATDGF